MISWDRQGDQMVLIFSPRQIRWLRRNLSWYQRNSDGHANPDGKGGHGAADQAVFSGQPPNRRATDTANGSSVTDILNALPDQGGVVTVGNSDRLSWAWTLQDLIQHTASRLEASGDDRLASALKSWLGEVAARLTTDVAFDDRVEQHLSELVHNEGRRRRE